MDERRPFPGIRVGMESHRREREEESSRRPPPLLAEAPKPKLGAMTGISSFMELVERVVGHLEAGSLQPGFMEPIQRGSASGFVMAVPAEAGGVLDLVLVVRLEIMTAPDGALRTAFMERLLELNHGFLGRASFSIDPDGKVALTAGRPVEDLDPGEILDLILWTSEQADLYDDELIEEFGDSSDS